MLRIVSGYAGRVDAGYVEGYSDIMDVGYSDFAEVLRSCDSLFKVIDELVDAYSHSCVFALDDELSVTGGIGKTNPSSIPSERAVDKRMDATHEEMLLLRREFLGEMSTSPLPSPSSPMAPSSPPGDPRLDRKLWSLSWRLEGTPSTRFPVSSSDPRIRGDSVGASNSSPAGAVAATSGRRVIRSCSLVKLLGGSTSGDSLSISASSLALRRRLIIIIITMTSKVMTTPIDIDIPAATPFL